MLKRTLALILIIGSLLVTPIAIAGNGDPINKGSADPLTLAVYGDWPYSAELLAKAPLLIDSINADSKVRLVMHVGDIHSGSMPCTGAGLNPIPATANPGWNQGIFNLFEQFKDPVIYTPGDNEWTDCHKTRQGSSGYPLNELAAVRSLFFADPGYTLGGRKKQVLTQAQEFDKAYPADAQFVENVMWEESQVVFVTLNVPGSNNDTLPWKGGTGAFLNEAARQQEVAERTAADLRWLKAAFEQAEEDQAQAVLIGLQADMWDPEALAPGGDGLGAYKPIVQTLADLSSHFGRPVLLINGDSHLFEADHPLADPASATGKIHGTQAVPNLTRITVQGSTNKPSEWLRLAIDPRSPQVFSWENVVYLP
ncbi:MAG TPA: metallophosphoesterase [Roseiflexaceae bacterium]|nr:metallophosphoesterase [Roseiflexaceae bacterium]